VQQSSSRRPELQPTNWHLLTISSTRSFTSLEVLKGIPDAYYDPAPPLDIADRGFGGYYSYREQFGLAFWHDMQRQHQS